MSKVITIAGTKGGTGKSVTAVNLATSLALYEKTTLLIDCDPQGCSTGLSGIKSLDYNCDLGSVFSGKVSFKGAVVKTEFNYLDIMPAGFNLFPSALKLSVKRDNEKLLRLFLKNIEDEYEYIFIDSSSSYGFLSVSAITAADWLVIALCPDQNSVEDFHGLLRLIKYVRKNHDTRLKIAGLLFNRCHSKLEIESFLKKENLSDVKDLVYDSFIPDDEKLKKSIELKMPVALYDIKSPAAAAYLSFAREMIRVFN
jgi:chromosome partitioning protein